MTLSFHKRTRFSISAKGLFDWHLRAGAIDRLIPPWEDIRILERPKSIAQGSQLVLEVPLLGPLKSRWVAEHKNIIAEKQFWDVQVEGPFKRWEHIHRMEADGDQASFLADRIEFEPPGSPFLNFKFLESFSEDFIKSKLESAFTYRHTVTGFDISRLNGLQKPKRILISGASGLVGSSLVPFLSTQGHTVSVLGRPRSIAPTYVEKITWDPEKELCQLPQNGEFEAVIHLAGENIANGSWSEEKKRRIRDSRIASTRLLSQALLRLPSKPKVFISASAVGIYGDRGEEELDESSGSGSGFLAEVGREWELASGALEEAGIRVVQARFGVIIDPRGGALKKMLLPAQLGVGGQLGDGKQWMSWVGIDDVLGAIAKALDDDKLQGPINVVAPIAVRNREFSETLARVLRRPNLLAVPEFALDLAFGEMARETILSSTRVVPSRLQASNFQFCFSTLEGCLRHYLGRTNDK